MHELALAGEKGEHRIADQPDGGPVTETTRYRELLEEERARLLGLKAVSYTHLTLPTIYSV